jgi:hypothetical protein
VLSSNKHQCCPTPITVVFGSQATIKIQGHFENTTQLTLDRNVGRLPPPSSPHERRSTGRRGVKLGHWVDLNQEVWSPKTWRLCARPKLRRQTSVGKGEGWDLRPAATTWVGVRRCLYCNQGRKGVQERGSDKVGSEDDDFVYDAWVPLVRDNKT